MQGQTHEGGVPAGQVILDGVIDQPDQLTVAVHQDRDEQITLRWKARKEDEGGETEIREGFLRTCEVRPNN